MSCSGVNVLDYGADPTGLAPSDQAVIAAMDVALADPDPGINQKIIFPKGQYLITLDNLMNRWTAPTSFRRNVAFVGDGPGISEIAFKPTVTEAYLYDGLAIPNRRFMFLKIQDLSIKTDATNAGGPINLFRLYGNDDGFPDQAWSFVDCRFTADSNAPGIVLRIEGQVNGSENSFTRTSGTSWANVISCANPQAVNHSLVQCNWENIASDIFYFQHGGSLNVVGGSYILNGGSLLFLEPTGAGISGTFNFYGVRTELRSGPSIYRVLGADAVPVVNIDGCSHRVALVSGHLVDVDVRSPTKFNFRGCDLINNLTVKFSNSSPTSSENDPIIAINGSFFIEDILKNIVRDPSARTGRVVINGV